MFDNCILFVGVPEMKVNGEGGRVLLCLVGHANYRKGVLFLLHNGYYLSIDGLNILIQCVIRGSMGKAPRSYELSFMLFMNTGIMAMIIYFYMCHPEG